MDDITQKSGSGRRSRGEGGGAAARRASRTGGGAGASLPYITRKIPVYEVLDEFLVGEVIEDDVVFVGHGFCFP